MLEFPTWKKAWYWALTLALCALSLPTILSFTSVRWPSALPEPKVNLGLDLAGGSRLLLEADRNQVVQQRLQGMEESVRTRLSQAEPRIGIGDVSSRGGRLTFTVRDTAQVDAAREAILPLTNGAGLSGQRDWDIRVENGNQFILSPTKAGIDLEVSNAMETAVEVVRKRIDALGTKEPDIRRLGGTRIDVQVPGLQDPAALKALLGQTAKLEFKLVDTQASPEDIARGIAPPGSQILPFTDAKAGYGQTAIAVKRLGGIKGDELTDAKQAFDPQSNAPVVSITFNSAGGAKFAKLTTDNVNKPFAIVLDNKVLSAPNINEPILGGSAQISGSFSVQEATQLAIALRSGALPVDLKVVEERTIGPDLGAEAIEKGALAMAVGTLALMVFIMFTYGHFGLYANAALIINVLMILGIMALLGTTLTLPGIAGFVLTIGATVDANVLINERIREERAKGRRVVQSVELGYKEASRAIFDANITNSIAAVLMFAFGSGPVRGFAVVLLIGIATSVFTAVTMTRMWVSGWLRRTRPTDLVL
jgi:preprotein translocase subunit SecD